MDDVSRGPDHSTGDPNQFHTEVGASTLTIQMRPVGPGAADDLARRYRRTPAGTVNQTDTYPFRSALDIGPTP